MVIQRNATTGMKAILYVAFMPGGAGRYRITNEADKIFYNRNMKFISTRNLYIGIGNFSKKDVYITFSSFLMYNHTGLRLGRNITKKVTCFLCVFEQFFS